MADHERRSFLGWTVHGMGLIFAAVVGAPAAAYLVDARNRPPRPKGMRPVQGVRLGALQTNDVVQGTIRDVRQDAWTLHPNDVIGRVWVHKFGDKPEDLQVYTTICPHLGCSINHTPSPSATQFTCPCHGAEFKADGAVVTRPNYNNPAPRAMDTLNWEAAYDPDNPDPANKDLLKVEYEDFVKGIDKKEPKGKSS